MTPDSPGGPAPTSVDLTDCARVVFASDFHLKSLESSTTRTAHHFLDEVGGSSDAVMLLGDVFDFWIGPASERSPVARSTLDLCAGLARKGVRLFFIPGNRDFLFDRATARANGITVLPDVAMILTQGRRILCLHGDQLCSLDRSYHIATRILRSGPVLALSRVLPVFLMRRLAEGYRDHSRRITRHKSRKSMDLCFEAVGELLATGCDGMVCGHVHQARRYASLAPSRRMELLVLSAWGRRGAYVNLEGGELELRWFEGTVEACPIVGEG